MCIFQKVKIEIYSEQPRLAPMYYLPGETEGEHRSRMYAERKKRREENIRLNKEGKIASHQRPDSRHWGK